MVIAALVTFGGLLAAWIVAPSEDRRRRTDPARAPEPMAIEASPRAA